MKLIDIASRIDKSKNNESYIDINKVAYELDYEFDDEDDQDRLKAYWIGNWYCTDSFVGYRMYFLDDEPVAVSIQNGRKCDEDFKWFNMDLALKVRDYLISITRKKEEELNFDTCDINEDIGNSFKISYNGQILNHNNATLDGQSIKILERIRETPDYGIDTNLKIQLPSGEDKIINISEIDFKYNLV